MHEPALADLEIAVAHASRLKASARTLDVAFHTEETSAHFSFAANLVVAAEERLETAKRAEFGDGNS